MDGSTITIPLSSSPDTSADRPEYIEWLRAEARGETYRPAARKKSGPTPPDPDAIRRLFTIETGNRWMELGEREPEAKMLFGEAVNQMS